MVKQIIWSNLAQENRREILKYWINHNKSDLYSRKLNKLFKDSVILISKHPKIGKKTDVTSIRIKTIRDYFLTYRETATTIEILTIWDSRQDPVNFDRIIR